MFEAMERGELTRALRASARTRRSPRPTSTAPCSCSRASTTWSCRTSSSRGPPRWPTSCCPAAAGWCEAEGTVTNSERRVQRVRKALDAARRGARRHRDPLRARAAPGPRLGPADAPRRSGTSCASLSPDARRHELRAARGSSAASSGRAPTRRIPASRSCTAGCGSDPVRGPARAVLASSSTSRRSTRSTTSSRSGSPPAGGSTRTTPACRPAATPRRCAAARRSTSRPRTRARSASPTASAVRVALAARRGRGAGAHRPGAAARASRS